MSNEILVVTGHQVKQDAEGRYCLNDLHKAAGGEAKHKPANWLRMDTTGGLIREIEISHIRAIFKKQGLGTFVVKELVYAYAMWISPAFNLKVIRAFDTLQTQGIAVAGIPAIYKKQGPWYTQRHDSVKRTIEMLITHGTVHPQIEDEPSTEIARWQTVTSLYDLNRILIIGF